MTVRRSQIIVVTTRTFSFSLDRNKVAKSSAIVLDIYRHRLTRNKNHSR